MKIKNLAWLFITASALSIGIHAQSPSATPTGVDSTYVRPDAKSRRNHYLMSTFGPETIGKNVLSAGFSTWRNKPREWGTHWDGFGRRFASNTAKTIISNSISYGLDEAMTLDSRFYKSKDRSIGARIKNALISPVTARRRDGTRTIGVPHIAGVYTSNIIADESWYPKRYNVGNALVGGTISLGTSALFNLVREFVK